MRRQTLCVLMIPLLLLTACGGSGTGGTEVDELALAIRSEYLAMERCTITADITADYGQRVYEFSLSAAVEGDKTDLTLTEPELVSGLTARVDGAAGILEYDGLTLETGPLDEHGLSPVTALPELLEAARSGYMADCVLEGEGENTRLRVRYADPEKDAGDGTETVLWFHPETHALTEGEISVDGLRVIHCVCTDFIN